MHSFRNYESVCRLSVVQNIKHIQCAQGALGNLSFDLHEGTVHQGSMVQAPVKQVGVPPSGQTLIAEE